MLILVLVWLAVALTMTLLPVPGMVTVARETDPLCLLCGDRGLADFLLNVAFFVPLGWAVARRWGWRWAVASGVILSLGIETLQLVIPGRFSTLGDLTANGSGACLGAWLAHREARVLPWSAAGAVIGLAAPLVFLAPAPPVGVYYGQWTARFGTMAHYEGRVLEAHVGGIPTPSRRSTRSEALRTALGSDGPVDVTFVVGPDPPSLAPLFSVFDGRRRRIFLLGVDGRDVVVLRWTRATTWKLDSPPLRWPGVMADVLPGDTAVIRFARGEDAPCLTLDGRTECDIVIGADAGWTLLLSPDGLGRPGYRVLGGLWMILMGILLAQAPGRRRTRIVLVVGTALLGMVVSAQLSYLRPTLLPALTLGLGAAMGMLLRRRTTSR